MPTIASMKIAILESVHKSEESLPRRPFSLRFSPFVAVLAILASAALGSDYTGKVLTPDGKPLKGATVYFADLRRERPISPTSRTELPTTRTDDAGDFHFPRGNSGRVEFIAAADGFGLSSVEVRGSGLIQIQLRPRTNLTLTFLNADNKPVPNLPVSVQEIYLPIRISEGSNNNLWIPADDHSPWSATTDAGGVCTLPGLPQGGHLTLNMDDERFAKLDSDDAVQLSGSTQVHVIHLQLAASIAGKVLYESTAKPATGVTVEVRANEETQQSVTGPDGSYILNRLQPGQYNLCVDLDSESQKSWTAASNISLGIAAGETKTNANFTLIPGVVLTGKVLSADDSKPVAGVPLGIYGPSHPRNAGLVQRISTDADGSISVRVPPGAERLHYVRHAGQWILQAARR